MNSTIIVFLQYLYSTIQYENSILHHSPHSNDLLLDHAYVVVKILLETKFSKVIVSYNPFDNFRIDFPRILIRK